MRSEGEKRTRGDINPIHSLQIDASSSFQQQRDDSGMTIQARNMEASVSPLRDQHRSLEMTDRTIELTKSRQSKEAPLSMRKQATSGCPQPQATNRGVFPF